MFDVALFEFENVLFETAAPRREALRRALGDDGVLLPEDAEPHAGCTVRDSVVAAGGWALPDDTAVELAALRAERYFAEHAAAGLSLAPGALALVHALAGRARLAIVSRSGRRDIDHALSLAGLDHAFTCVVGAEDAAAPKPASAPYETAIARLGRRAAVCRDRAIAFEDALPGIESARAAGVRCIAVGDIAAHHALHADAFLPSLAELTMDGLRSLATPERAR
jgi:HAD superfamily hydrolase (TIGR01509 family)